MVYESLRCGPFEATILERIKWKIEASLPQIQLCTRATTKTRHFFAIIFHPFCPRLILKRIKWEMEAPFPPIEWCTRATTKTRHFSHRCNVGRGGLNLSSILSKIVDTRGPKTVFLTPTRYDEHLHHFCMKSPSEGLRLSEVRTRNNLTSCNGLPWKNKEITVEFRR